MTNEPASVIGTSDLVGVRIPIPAEAIVPLLIGIAALLVLLFAGASLKAWKEKNPGVATKVGMVLALACTGFALYTVIKVFPEIDMRSRTLPVVQHVEFFDGPTAGFLALIGAILWSFANQKWIGVATGSAIGLALLLKPFVFPLRRSVGDRTWGLIDPEHLAFLGPGLAVAIVVVIVAIKPRR
jgi:hypothetical protein